MKMRILIKKNEADPSKDLAIASSLRRDLYAYSPVEIDPDNPEFKTYRYKDNRQAFFEFETEYPQEVRRVIREHNYENLVEVQEISSNVEAAK